MYAEDNRDKINGLGRQLRSIATDDRLDPEDLAAAFGKVQADLDGALLLAVGNLREQGHSWDAIAAGLGITRQAAHKRFRNSCLVLGVPA